MIDDSDGDFTLLLGSSAGSWWVWVAFLLAAIVLYSIAEGNAEDCSSKHCDVGKPVLTHHECVCETKAN